MKHSKHCHQKIISYLLVFVFSATIFLSASVVQAADCSTIDATNELEVLLCKPQPRIKIPGLEFTVSSDFDELVGGEGGGTYIDAPFLGEYIAGIYKYAVAAASILAILMIIVSGLQWMSPGNVITSVITKVGGDKAEEQTNQAKKRMVGAVTGLIIAVSSYVILYTINPELVRFQSLRIQYVEKIDFPELTRQMVYLDSGGEAVFTPISDGTHRETVGVDQPLEKEEIFTLSEGTGMNPCIVYATYKTEAGSANDIGHDENVRRCSIRSRRYFLASGSRHNGSTFTPPYGSDPTNYVRGSDMCSMEIRNTDRFNPSSPPDYGLDWRFSHGIGLGQYTIFPNYTYGDEAHRRENQRILGPNGPEWARYNSAAERWYTVTDLLNPDLAFEATLGLMVRCDRRYRESGGSPIEFRNCYGGGSDSSNPSDWGSDPPEPRFMKNYCACVAEDGSRFGIPSEPMCNYYE